MPSIIIGCIGGFAGLFTYMKAEEEAYALAPVNCLLISSMQNQNHRAQIKDGVKCLKFITQKRFY
jgi:hypothetical protein